VTFEWVSLPSVITIPKVDAPQRPGGDYVFNELRRIERLAIVEVDLIDYEYYDASVIPSQDEMEDIWNNLKCGFVDVLKKSTSENSKLLRWRALGRPLFHGAVESGEMGVSPEASL
jgi:hypothetical protein